MSSAVLVADLDREKKYPISAYDIVGAVGIALPGIAILVVMFMEISKRRKP
jgi:hypothetical protein